MRGRPLWSVVAALVTGLAVGYAAALGPPKMPEPVRTEIPDPVAVAGLLPARPTLLPANEASGIVASRKDPGLYFWLRDGGPDKPGRPRDALWGLRIGTGHDPEEVRGGELFPTFPVSGASNVDWEALTVDDTGDLWIGELGANDCQRRQRLYRVPEPDPATEGMLPVLASYALRFPDNPKRGCRTFNSEAMFWLDGHLYLFAKTDRSPVYRVDLPATGDQATVTRVGQLGPGIDNISASSISDDRTRLMVLDHKRMWVYEVDPARRGDDLVLDAISRAPRWQADFGADGGASVEGGTFARGSHDLAFVAEDRRIYVTGPDGYGDTPPTQCPTPSPSPSTEPTESPTPDPSATPSPTPDFAVDPPPATPQPTTSST